MAAKQARLKVYRTAIGFHDAYVAAPSRKAALAAWGTTKDLFARQAAELVEDPALTAEPLARPGAVIKRARGTTAEQIAALPQDKPKPAAKKPVAKPAAPPEPRPSRAALDRAEQAIARLQQRHDAAIAKLRKEERALADRRRTLETKQAEQRAALQDAADDARAAYDAAMETWRG